MNVGITKGDVETAVKSLNEAAEALGIDRRFTVEFGSKTMGTAHRLYEEHPRLSHPTISKIGHTRGEAHAYLSAMTHALRSAFHDRSYRREDLVEGRSAPVDAVRPLFADPDARSTRRSGEESTN